MANDEGLDRLLGEIKKKLANGKSIQGSKPNLDLIQQIREDYQRNRQSTLTSSYIDGDLHAIVLPLSQSESIVHISNLDDIVVEQRRDSVRNTAIYTYQDAGRNALCDRVAQTVLLYRDQFPANYDTSLSKKEKAIGIHLMTTAVPSSVLEVASKEKILPSGERISERIKVLSGISSIIDATKFSLGILGSLTGASIGGLAGPPGAVAGGLAGFVIGYFSPAIAGGTYIVARKKMKINERQEYDRIRNAISNISNQVRLQEAQIQIAILPDFEADNISPYLDSSQGIQIFRQPTRTINARWVYDAFRSVVDSPDIFLRMNQNMQRYYRQKIRDYERMHNTR